MDKIESVCRSKRIRTALRHGDVTIHGIGVRLEPLRDVDRPIALPQIGHGKLRTFEGCCHCSSVER